MVSKGRKRGVHRHQRPRRPLPGMLHIDGSEHRWFQGIQQKFHAPPPEIRSISSLPIRSKSSGTEICPAMKPSRRI